jgi:hypothetical protein
MLKKQTMKGLYLHITSLRAVLRPEEKSPVLLEKNGAFKAIRS